MIILVGASASGKSVVVKKMSELYGVKKIVTYTTRAMRVGEINHIDYHFVTQEDFLEKKEKNFFVETAYYNNNYYGTAIEDISVNKALIVEPNGANIYYEKLKDKVYIVYLKADKETRRKRMLERGDSLEVINKRMANDEQYFALENFLNIDLMVDTENISIDEVANIIYGNYCKLFIK